MSQEAHYASIPLPPDLGERLRQVFGLQSPPATLGDIVRMRSRAELTESDLCCSRSSRHLVRTAGQSRYTNCIIDALLLSVLEGMAAEIESESPQGDVVRMTVTRDRVSSANPDVVVSYGVARAGQGPVRQIACPYINAFPSRSAYERWAAATPEAITLAMSLADAFAFVRDLATYRGRRVGQHTG